MNHENQIKDYERRLQGMGDAIVEKDAAASKLRVEIDSLRLTNQRLVAEVEELKQLNAHRILTRIDLENECAELRAEVARMKKELLEANEMLRAAKSISEREGAQTNWNAFNAGLEKMLLHQHEILREYRESRIRELNASLRDLESQKGQV